jgi:hypothetical protein
MVPVDYFLFSRGKTDLAAISMMQETFHKAWDGVLMTIAKEDCVAAFRRLKERFKKCVRIGNGYDKK